MPFTQLHIYSKVLRQEQQIWAILPDLKAFDVPDKKFRTLWLMPSGSNDFTDWERHSDIENMAKERDLVVIVPGLYKSTGTNMAMGPHYAEFVAKELPETLRLIQKGLKGVTQPGGTGAWFANLPVPVAGKTGTAENPHGQDHGWFIAYAPAEKPDLVIACIVEQGSYGATAAGPVVYDVLQSYLTQRIKNETKKADEPMKKRDSLQ